MENGDEKQLVFAKSLLTTRTGLLVAAVALALHFLEEASGDLVEAPTGLVDGSQNFVEFLHRSGVVLGSLLELFKLALELHIDLGADDVGRERPKGWRIASVVLVLGRVGGCGGVEGVAVGSGVERSHCVLG